jgi:hypothetical protein
VFNKIPERKMLKTEVKRSLDHQIIFTVLVLLRIRLPLLQPAKNLIMNAALR